MYKHHVFFIFKNKIQCAELKYGPVYEGLLFIASANFSDSAENRHLPLATPSGCVDEGSDRN